MNVAIDARIEPYYRGSVEYLARHGIETPRDISIGISDKLLHSAVSHTDGLYEYAWADLVVSELDSRYGLKIPNSQVSLSWGITGEDLGDEDIIVGWPLLIGGEGLLLHELWHIIGHRKGQMAKNPLLAEGEARYVEGLYADLGLNQPGSLGWFKYEGPSNIVRGAMVEGGKSLVDLLEDDSFRARTENKILEFYRDPQRTPGYVFIPRISDVIRNIDCGDTMTSQNIVDAYNELDEPQIAAAVQGLADPQRLVNDVGIAYGTGIFLRESD